MKDLLTVRMAKKTEMTDATCELQEVEQQVLRLEALLSQEAATACTSSPLSPAVEMGGE